MNRAVFLDRDGTLIEDRDYLHRPEEVVIFPGVGPALKRLQEAGFKLFIVTNQSGVGRGYFPIEDVHRVHEHLARELAKEGVRIEKFYIAPEAPDAPSRGRKPSPQFLFDARDEFGIDLAQSYMIGDKLIDLECGWNAGVKRSILVRTGYGTTVEQNSNVESALVVDDLLASADWIVTHSSICGQPVVSRDVDGWQITWEGTEEYRHWALLEQRALSRAPIVATVMLNPGSLRGDGNLLGRDDTLRVLRTVFEGIARCLILNLFDVAAAKPKELFGTYWSQRDKPGMALVYELAGKTFRPAGIVWAFGDCKGCSLEQEKIIHERQTLIGNIFANTPECWPRPGEQSTHPRRWKLTKRIDDVRRYLIACLASAQ